MGVQSQFVNGLRVTDAEAMDVVQMVLAGKVGKSLVNLIGSIGRQGHGHLRARRPPGRGQMPRTPPSARWAPSQR